MIVPQFFHVVVIKLLRVDAVSLNVYLLCELFYGDIIEVHVRDSRKKPFEYEHICFFSWRAIFCSVCKGDKCTDKLVLINCCVGFFAAYAYFSVTACVVCSLLTLETKHIFHW